MELYRKTTTLSQAFGRFTGTEAPKVLVKDDNKSQNGNNTKSSDGFESENRNLCRSSTTLSEAFGRFTTAEAPDNLVNGRFSPMEAPEYVIDNGQSRTRVATKVDDFLLLCGAQLQLTDNNSSQLVHIRYPTTGFYREISPNNME